MKCFVVASLAVLVQSATMQPQIETEQRGSAAQKPTGCASNCSDGLEDQLALLQVTSHVKNREAAKPQPILRVDQVDEFIYDLWGTAVKVDAVYHAAIQIQVGDSKGASFLVEMSPVATVRALPHWDPPYQRGVQQQLFPGKVAHPMFVANKAVGTMATCEEDGFYDSNALRLASGDSAGTLATLADWWSRNSGKKWHPGNYNCQSFAKEVLGRLADQEGDMDEAIRVLGHNGDVIAGGITNTWANTAGAIANAFGSVESLFQDRLEDIGNDDKFKAALNLPIVQVRLWYVTTTQTFGTTSEGTRADDYVERRKNLCSYVQKHRLAAAQQQAQDLSKKGTSKRRCEMFIKAFPELCAAFPE